MVGCARSEVLGHSVEHSQMVARAAIVAHRGVSGVNKAATKMFFRLLLVRNGPEINIKDERQYG